MKRAIPLAILTIALAASLGLSFEQASAAPPPDCELICTCFNRTTDNFTRVGHNCARAQTRAAEAAAAAAVCNPGETSCGPVTVYVTFNCFPHPVSGQTAARAFATYKCERCRLVCDRGPFEPEIQIP